MKNAVLLSIIGVVAPKDVIDGLAQVEMDEKIASKHRRDARAIQHGADRNLNHLLERIGAKPALNGCDEKACPHCGMKPSQPHANEVFTADVAPRGWDKV